MLSDIKVRDIYQPDGQYGHSARYPTEERHYEPESFIHGDRARAAELVDLLVSSDPADRVRAMVYIESIRVTVPAFVVLEAPESPNLFRHEQEDMSDERRQQILANRTHWSVHVDGEEAIAWAAKLQEKHDAHIAKHPWWGPDSRRVFGVEWMERANIRQLRQPGADPDRHIRAFE